MLSELLLFFAILYAIQILTFASGVRRAHYSRDTSYRPRVSVIIAARNEEANLPSCLESISRLTYPKEKLEVMIVNDRSTDGTEQIIKRVSKQFPFIKMHNATDDPDGRLHGKTNAITQGIESTTGEILLFTDADCVVQKGWIEETVKYYDTPSVGLVAGFTSLRSRTLFEAIQALDWFVLFSIAAGLMRLRFPVTAVGNNLSVRREAYESVGGYRIIPFSVTEDLALVRAITATRLYILRFPLDRQTLVFSLPCESWQNLFSQKKRWFSGGVDMDWRRIALFSVGYLFKLSLVLALVVEGIVPFLFGLALKVITDYLLVRPALTTFHKHGLAWYFIPFEIYYILYVLLFPLVVIFNRNVHWKERKLS